MEGPDDECDKLRSQIVSEHNLNQEIHVKDRVRTLEHNILTQENRKTITSLLAIKELIIKGEYSDERVLELINEVGDHLPIARLRHEQAARVMPLIGGLLDTYEQLPNDIASEQELHDLVHCIEMIQTAMEDEHPNNP